MFNLLNTRLQFILHLGLTSTGSGKLWNGTHTPHPLPQCSAVLLSILYIWYVRWFVWFQIFGFWITYDTVPCILQMVYQTWWKMWVIGITDNTEWLITLNMFCFSSKYFTFLILILNNFSSKCDIHVWNVPFYGMGLFTVQVKCISGWLLPTSSPWDPGVLDKLMCWEI